MKPLTWKKLRRLDLTAPARRLEILCSAGMLLISGAAHAQEDQPVQLNKIIVTGSAVPRTDTETAAPVQIITKKDIDRSGLSTTAEVVQAISANNNGSVTPNYGDSFAVGAAGIALRGLNVNRTLVLIDGRRAANYGLADDGYRGFVDLNSIPINQIERIEVLKDGASSLYGADAIAGVVNIITKREFHGLDASGEFGTSQHGGGFEKRFSATLGGGDLAANGRNAYVGIEYQKDDKIHVSQRKFPYNTTDLSSIGGVDSRIGNPSAFTGSVFGNVTPGTLGTPGDFTSGVPLAGAASVPLRACGAGTQQVTDPTSGNVYCAQNQASFADDQPQDERFGIFSRFTIKLDEQAEAYLSATYYQNKVTYDLQPSQVNNAAPLNTNAIALPVTLSNGTLNPNNPFAAAGNVALLNYAFGDIPSGTQTFNQNYRLVSGIKGTFADWDYDSAVVINHASLQESLYGFINGPQLLTDVGDGAYSFIDPASNTPAVRNALAPVLSTITTTDLDSVDFRVTRSLWNLPGGPLGLALGTEYRYEAITNPDLNPNNDVQGLGQSFAHGTRNVEAVYTEFDAPLLKSLEVDLSARYDHYSDFTGAGTRPKLGVKWTPIEQVAIRGTASEGFRAPSFSENGASAVGSFDGPVTPPAAFATAHGGDGYVTIPYFLSSADIGNPAIKPEKAENFTFGAVFQPVKQFSASVDYYFIRVRDAIETNPPDAAIAAYYAGAPIPPGFTVTPDKPDSADPAGMPRLAAVGSGFINAASISTEGIDVDLTGKVNLQDGIHLLSDLEYTEVLSYKIAQPGEAPVQYVGTDSPFAENTSPGTSRVRATWVNTIIVGPAELSGTVHYESGITLFGLDVAPPGVCLSSAPSGAPFPGNCREPHFVYFDMTGLYHLSKNFELTATIENVFDARPPFEPAIGAGTNFDPTFAQPGIVGRFFRAGVRYHFG